MSIAVHQANKNCLLVWVLFQRASLINARKRLQTATAAPAILKRQTACNWFTPPAIGILLKRFRFSHHAFLLPFLFPIGTGHVLTRKRHSRLRFPFPAFVFIVANRNRLHPAILNHVLQTFGITTACF